MVAEPTFYEGLIAEACIRYPDTEHDQRVRIKASVWVRRRVRARWNAAGPELKAIQEARGCSRFDAIHVLAAQLGLPQGSERTDFAPFAV